MNNCGKKKGGEGNRKYGGRGVNGAYNLAGFIFNCTSWFFMVMSALPPFQNNQIVDFCKSGHLSLKRFVFEKVAIIAKWLLCFSKHGKALGWLRFQVLAPNERPNHIEGKDGSVLLHQTQPVVYLLKHNTQSFILSFSPSPFLPLRRSPSNACHDCLTTKPDQS